jgi:subtilisin family serine protease
VAVYAPGEWVPSTFLTRAGDPAYDGWASWSGTSFAAPLIAGHVAAKLARSGGPAASGVVRNEVIRDAMQAGGPCLEPEYGFIWASGLHGEAVPD